MSKPEPTIDLDRARERLREERERIEDALADLERVITSEKEEEAVDSARAAQLRAELEAVERAQKRLEEGTYGLCVESGEPIPAERLEAIPWAERTVEEQERYQRTHGSVY
jgi:DnaK suppressor protein